MDLSEKQWKRLEPLLPEQKKTGRPRTDDRAVLNGIMWVLRTGAPWKDLPNRYPPYQTCHRRFQTWAQEEVMAEMLEQIAQDLYEQGDIDLSECFIDGSFAPAKKGDSTLVKQKKVKEPRLWSSQTQMVFRSPLTHNLLITTKLSLSQALLKQGLSPIYPKDL